jgi:hypothetical protein
MAYSKIINPKTGRKVSITGKLGQNILRNYISVLRGGSIIAPPTEAMPLPIGEAAATALPAYELGSAQQGGGLFNAVKAAREKKLNAAVDSNFKQALGEWCAGDHVLPEDLDAWQDSLDNGDELKYEEVVPGWPEGKSQEQGNEARTFFENAAADNVLTTNQDVCLGFPK